MYKKTFRKIQKIISSQKITLTLYFQLFKDLSNSSTYFLLNPKNFYKVDPDFDDLRFCLTSILLNFKQNRIQTVKIRYRCCNVPELYNVYEIFKFIFQCFTHFCNFFFFWSNMVKINQKNFKQCVLKYFEISFL